MRNAVKVGHRLWLRPMTPADARTLSQASHLERESGFQSGGRVPSSSMAFERWIQELEETGTPEHVVFAVCRLGDDRCIGTVRFGPIDWVNRTAETGTGILLADDRGQGLGTEAKHLLLEYAFHDLGLHALHSMVYSGNARSAAALEKQGYQLAGRLTADVQRGGTFRDTLLFDITRADWERAYVRWRQDFEYLQNAGERTCSL